jgi:hypothetical protein
MEYNKWSNNMQMGSNMLGSFVGGVAGACWIAREVYGQENIKWIIFREWLLNDAPSWFHRLYIKYGPSFAKYISNKPIIKSIIRRLMNKVVYDAH